MNWLAATIATWFGIGLLPFAAALMAVASTGMLFNWFGHHRMIWIIALGAVIPAGLWASYRVEELTGISDDGRIVVDEVTGAALLLAVAGVRAPWRIAALLIAFLVIDRFKPWPMSAVEAAPGPWGVMGDDLVLGLLMGLTVLLVRRIRSPSARRHGT